MDELRFTDDELQLVRYLACHLKIQAAKLRMQGYDVASDQLAGAIPVAVGLHEKLKRANNGIHQT